MSMLVDIAEAVKDALNVTSFSLPFTAERLYVPAYSIDDGDLDTLKVPVVPATVLSTLIDRSGKGQRDHVVNIGLFQKLDPTLANVDPLTDLADEMIDLFHGKALPGWPGNPVPVCISAQIQTVHDPAYLDEKRAFASLIVLTFRLGR